MANKAKGANVLNKRYLAWWAKERSQLAEPWRIPNSPVKGWKKRLAASVKSSRGNRPKELVND